MEIGLIMTSNIGAQKITGNARKSLGFTAEGGESAARTFEQIKEDVLAELKTAVRPEFLNRIDDIIVFDRLNEDEIAQIADEMCIRDRLEGADKATCETLAAELLKKHII